MKDGYIFYFQRSNKLMLALFGNFILFFSVAAFLTIAYKLPATFWFFVSVSVLVLVGKLISVFVWKRPAATAIPFAIVVIGWLHPQAGNVMMAFFMAALIFLRLKAAKPAFVRLNKASILFHNLFKKEFRWNDVSNVMLKDGLLTIDFKSNRIFQKMTDDAGDATEEQTFNAFCKARIESSSKNNS